MTLTASAFLAFLACVNFCVRRSLFYPPVLYCAWWSLLLAIAALSGDAFYPLSMKTLAVFILGASVFTIGGYLRILHRPVIPIAYPISSIQENIVSRFLVFGIIGLVAAFPFYWDRLQQLKAASYYNDFWRGVRQQSMSGLLDERGFGGYAYLMVIASFLSLIAVYHNDGSRKARLRAVILILITLTYDFLTAARTGAMTTLLGILTVSRIRSGKVNWKLWCICGISLAIIFTVPAILLHKGGDTSKSLTENAAGVLQSLQVYTVGGMVAFNQVMGDVTVFPNWLSFRFFFALAHAVGFDVTVPRVVLPFTATPALTNVYTIYGSYFADFGWLGVAGLLCLLGYLLTMLYQSAIRQRPESVILFGIAASYLVMTAATDGFLIAMSYWLQAFLFTLAVYRWPFARHGRVPRALIRCAPGATLRPAAIPAE